MSVSISCLCRYRFPNDAIFLLLKQGPLMFLNSSDLLATNSLSFFFIFEKFLLHIQNSRMTVCLWRSCTIVYSFQVLVRNLLSYLCSLVQNVFFSPSGCLQDFSPCLFFSSLSRMCLCVFLSIFFLSFCKHLGWFVIFY